jgi:hypothetical protein
LYASRAGLQAPDARRAGGLGIPSRRADFFSFFCEGLGRDSGITLVGKGDGERQDRSGRVQHRSHDRGSPVSAQGRASAAATPDPASKGDTFVQVKTNVKAGIIVLNQNHHETLVRGLKVQTGVKAGATAVE